MDESEKGNLCVYVEDIGSDEISRLSKKFNIMIKSINTLVKDVRISSGHVLNDTLKVSGLSTALLSSSEEISATVQQVAEGASNQAQDSTECVEQMNILSTSVNLVDNDMNSIGEVVDSTSRLSIDVREIMDQLNTKTLISKNVSSKITDDINKLNNEMKKITSIINTIEGLSDQTNLLSLNAAIEAARAGEAGRGFAVVASEVKKLADQSKQASSTITAIIGSIQLMTQETVIAASKADSIFKEQMECVVIADNKTNIILGFMGDITSKINDMKSTVNDIFFAKEKTMASIENISAVSEQNAATSEEVAARTDEQMGNSKQLMLLALSLNEMTEVMTKAISNFKIENDLVL